MTITNHDLDETVVLPKGILTDDVDKAIFDLKLTDILEIVKCTQIYKNTIKELELDNKKLQEQLDLIKKVINNTTRNSDTNNILNKTNGFINKDINKTSDDIYNTINDNTNINELNKSIFDIGNLN